MGKLVIILIKPSQNNVCDETWGHYKLISMKSLKAVSSGKSVQKLPAQYQNTCASSTQREKKTTDMPRKQIHDQN